MLPSRSTALIALLYTVIGLAIYSNVLLNGIFLFDDFEYVIGNPLIQDFSNFDLSDPRQIGYLSFAVNFALGGEDPRGFHLVNVLIHITNAILVFFLIQLLLMIIAGPEYSRRGRRYGVISFLTGLLFLVHPIETQAVSYITQRFTSLAAFFYLISACGYLAARRRFESHRESRTGWMLFSLSFLSALLAMRTKEIAFTIPFTIAALEFLLFRNSAFGVRRFVYLIPHVVLLAVIPLSIFGPELGLIGQGEGIAEVTRKEKLYDLFARSFSEYFLTQFRVIVIYLRLLILPVGQRVVYDLKASHSFFEPKVVLSLSLILLVMAFAYRFWRKASSASPEDAAGYRLTALGILWFFLTLSVESSVIPIKDLIFEHRVYLPSVGFFAACSALLVKAGTAAVKRLPLPQTAAAGILVAAIALPLSAGTYARNEVWTDEVRFWDDVVKKNPDKAIGYHNRGNAYAKIGNYGLALLDIDRTIGFFPKNPGENLGYEYADFTPMNMAKTFMNRGAIYLDMGDQERAGMDFEKARKLMTVPVVDTEKTLKLADAYAKKGAFKHAIEEYNKILEWDPENLSALNDRANAFSWAGNYRDAIRDFSRIVLLDPDNALAYHNRGIAHAWSGEKEKAVEDFKKACGMGFPRACESIEIAERGGK